jgi:hypothetical protein
MHDQTLVNPLPANVVSSFSSGMLFTGQNLAHFGEGTVPNGEETGTPPCHFMWRSETDSRGSKSLVWFWLIDET